jgi:hypothetical protein
MHDTPEASQGEHDERAGSVANERRRRPSPARTGEAAILGTHPVSYAAPQRRKGLQQDHLGSSSGIDDPIDSQYSA